MKSMLSTVAGLLLTTATFAQQPADSAQDPTVLGNAFFKAMLDEDAGTVAKSLADNCSVTSFNGQSVDGSLLVQGISGGEVIVETATVSGTQTRLYNNDSAVMTGNWQAKGSIQGKAFNNSVAFSVVCARQSNSWKIVNIQFTPIVQ